MISLVRYAAVRLLMFVPGTRPYMHRQRVNHRRALLEFALLIMQVPLASRDSWRDF